METAIASRMVLAALVRAADDSECNDAITATNRQPKITTGTNSWAMATENRSWRRDGKVLIAGLTTAISDAHADASRGHFIVHAFAAL
jgi:hypothetical protein